MNKLATVTIFAILLLGPLSVYAQNAMSTVNCATSQLRVENHDYDNLWASVQISLLIAFSYLLYWLKQGAFD